MSLVSAYLLNVYISHGKKVVNLENKWIRAAIPALLIHISVGTVYCWSTFKAAIAEQIGMSSFSIGWAFSLAIFFLGMSAAFAGNLVEKDINKSSLVACICFSIGMIGTGVVINYFTGRVALYGIYLCYGAIMGIGLGVGYLTPVKTLMLWFNDTPGLATGISIMGFGLAKAIATPIMSFLVESFGITTMFCTLGVLYFVLMYIAHVLLRKPDGWVEPKEKNVITPSLMFRDREFLGIWTMFFLNIHCGLMIISCEKQLITSSFLSSPMLPIAVGIIPSITAAFNALGRIGYSTLSDRTNQRTTIYRIIFMSCAAMAFLTYFTHSLHGANGGAMLFLFLLVINAGYGGGFSTLPALLSERFGMKNISRIHGIALSAWALAGITGNNLTEIVLRETGEYDTVLIISALLYAVALLVNVIVVKNKPIQYRSN